MDKLLVDELPRVRAVEAPHPHRCNEFGHEVAQVDSMFGARQGIEWFPMGNATAGLAVNGPESSVTPDVRCCGLRVPRNGHSTELEVDPRSTDAAAQGTVAGRRNRWRRRKSQANGAAVARAFVHWMSPQARSTGER